MITCAEAHGMTPAEHDEVLRSKVWYYRPGQCSQWRPISVGSDELGRRTLMVGSPLTGHLVVVTSKPGATCGPECDPELRLDAGTVTALVIVIAALVGMLLGFLWGRRSGSNEQPVRYAKCHCTHGIQCHKNRGKGECAVDVGKAGCACRFFVAVEPTVEEVLAQSRRLVDGSSS